MLNIIITSMKNRAFYAFCAHLDESAVAPPTLIYEWFQAKGREEEKNMISARRLGEEKASHYLYWKFSSRAHFPDFCFRSMRKRKLFFLQLHTRVHWYSSSIFSSCNLSFRLPLRQFRRVARRRANFMFVSRGAWVKAPSMIRRSLPSLGYLKARIQMVALQFGPRITLQATIRAGNARTSNAPREPLEGEHVFERKAQSIRPLKMVFNQSWTHIFIMKKAQQTIFSSALSVNQIREIIHVQDPLVAQNESALRVDIPSIEDNNLQLKIHTWAWVCLPLNWNSNFRQIFGFD